MKHHNLDIYPLPKGTEPLFVNEPWLIDESLADTDTTSKDPENQTDNIRIYIPLDLNREAIIRRLKWIVCRYGSASEKNEMQYDLAVSQIVSQIEIYDQIWRVREYDPEREHSIKAIELVKEFVEILKEIPDECSETFPFDLISELEKEYLRNK